MFKLIAYSLTDIISSEELHLWEIDYYIEIQLINFSFELVEYV